jgi:hypothetical protein
MLVNTFRRLTVFSDQRQAAPRLNAPAGPQIGGAGTLVQGYTRAEEAPDGRRLSGEVLARRQLENQVRPARGEVIAVSSYDSSPHHHVKGHMSFEERICAGRRSGSKRRSRPMAVWANHNSVIVTLTGGPPCEFDGEGEKEARGLRGKQGSEFNVVDVL